ncbi:aspartate/glutamate racemase family protein [Granulosicoccus sp. 3-233]|uniref:aspartate/glutamate racemase family protein n=1 Tax=Granulosicoccus sp. 3-233 TaxID=3417969 RepID=UPI003D359059
MKTIGIIGGMSWESSVLYYQAINRGVAESLGGLHSASLILYSVDFADIERLQHEGDWEAAGSLLNEAALALQAAGADFLVIATNTMHKVADSIVDGIDIPLLHIVDPTAEALLAAGHRRVGLLGTAFTMSDDFYKGRMQETFGLDVIVPDDSEQAQVHRIIYEELCLGIIEDASREVYTRIIDGLLARGAQAVILGCTEITLLINQAHTPAPLFDTTALHAAAAVSRALGHD